MTGELAVLVARAQRRDAVARMTAGIVFALTPKGVLQRPSQHVFMLSESVQSMQSSG